MLSRVSTRSFRRHAFIRPQILPKQRLRESSCLAASIGRRFLPLGIDNVEDVDEYRPGGYHPVHLGDIFNGRYKVIHKLGSGGFSTTWLARDQAVNGYRALKVLKAEETETSTELRTLRWLSALQTDHPGVEHVRRLNDHFVIHGPNGNHACLVSEMGGPSLHDLYNVAGRGYAAGSRRLRADIAHSVVRQVVEAVDLLHSHRVCHGDLTVSNILLAMKTMDTWTEDEMHNAFGKPSRLDLVPAPNADIGRSAPSYVVEPAQTPDAKFLSHDALLVDFGESFPFAKPPKLEEVGLPLMYRAPETIFESKLSPASEAWSLACLLFEIRAGNPLFTSVMGGRNEIIQQMVQMKGRLPDPWWQSWDKRSMCFDEKGKPHTEWDDGIAMTVEYPVEEMIADIGSQDEEAAFFGSEVEILEPKYTTVPEKEAESMADLLNRVLRWKPEERLSVAEILQHPWISGEHG